MAGFADQLTIRYLDPAAVRTLLVPAGDTTFERVRALLVGVPQPVHLHVETVDDVTVRAVRFQVPVRGVVRVCGEWESLTPPGGRNIATLDLPSQAAPLWIDMMLDTVVQVRVSAQDGPLDGVTAEDVSAFTEDEFVARFAFVDVPDLLRAAGLATYQELQAEFPHLQKLHFADPPPFSPDDPAVRRTYRLPVSALFCPSLDVVDALRRVEEARGAVDSLEPTPIGGADGDARTSASAWLAIFPDSAAGPGTPTREQIGAALAAGGSVAVFEAV